ncbi:TMEM165/GDT1 family protein [bacterium]|jgi:putative Ca2+/H+ antiporter (TMEM165/GDT1 family)|nr:TMEM165/GDT1 family protein [bacterium]
MDFKIFVMAFGAIFFAELADKTQLIGLCLSGKTGRPLLVWAGSVGAYIIVTGLTVLIGAHLGKCLKVEIIKYFGGALFVLLGALMLFGKI